MKLAGFFIFLTPAFLLFFFLTPSRVWASNTVTVTVRIRPPQDDAQRNQKPKESKKTLVMEIALEPKKFLKEIAGVKIEFF